MYNFEEHFKNKETVLILGTGRYEINLIREHLKNNPEYTKLVTQTYSNVYNSNKIHFRFRISKKDINKFKIKDMDFNSPFFGLKLKNYDYVYIRQSIYFANNMIKVLNIVLEKTNKRLVIEDNIANGFNAKFGEFIKALETIDKEKFKVESSEGLTTIERIIVN